MKTTELLEKNPLSTEVIRTWFFNEMVKSFDDETVPEEFKEMMKQEGVTNERLAVLIDAQPRTLFDVFDKNDIFISSIVRREANENILYTCSTNMIDNQYHCNTRKEAEVLIIKQAFKILEEKLTPIDLPEVKE